jgi:hypothetical protein
MKNQLQAFEEIKEQQERREKEHFVIIRLLFLFPSTLMSILILAMAPPKASLIALTRFAIILLIFIPLTRLIGSKLEGYANRYVFSLSIGLFLSLLITFFVAVAYST